MYFNLPEQLLWPSRGWLEKLHRSETWKWRWEEKRQSWDLLYRLKHVAHLLVQTSLQDSHRPCLSLLRCLCQWPLVWIHDCFGFACKCSLLHGDSDWDKGSPSQKIIKKFQSNYASKIRNISNDLWTPEMNLSLILVSKFIWATWKPSSSWSIRAVLVKVFSSITSKGVLFTTDIFTVQVSWQAPYGLAFTQWTGHGNP